MSVDDYLASAPEHERPVAEALLAHAATLDHAPLLVLIDEAYEADA